MKLSSISLLLLVVGCSTNPASDAGATRDVGSGGSDSSTGGSGGSSGAINVPIGGSSSAGTSSAGTSSAGTSSAGTSALGGASTGGSAGTASGGSAGTSSGDAGGSAGTGTSSGGTSSGGGGSMLQTDITARYEASETNTSSPVPAILGKLSVVNADGGNAHLDLLKVRYYFTNEAPALTFVLQNGLLQWPGNQAQLSLTGTVVKMADPKPTADSYLELAFQGTLILDAGKTALIDFRLYNTPSQQPILIQSNDYSFNLPPAVDTDKIVLLYRDVVIWGVEP
ncbi:MAG TPA: cellulose binding domain-containing protein [Polyangiaceae bacterium]|jgi:hypothetical protein|nr:cellulose binding domain-containing protein [Polyangiaceae bacterium]